MAKAFFSILRKSSIKTIAFLALLFFGFSVNACGPDYSYWHDLKPNLHYDPITPQNRDSTALYQYFIGSQAAPATYKDVAQHNEHLLYSTINQLLDKSNRKFLISIKGKTYFDNIGEPQKKHIHSIDLLGYQYFWGNCQSNNIDSILNFLRNVIKQPALKDEQIFSLIKLRQELRVVCEDKTQLTRYHNSLDTSKSPFHIYLKAASAFYLNDFQTSEKLFSNLLSNNIPWLAETSQYMIARNKLNESSSEWNGWEEKKNKIDQKQSLLAADLFKKYIQLYPQGIYLRSAKGLIRRAYWLADFKEQYKDELLIFNSNDISAYAKTNYPTQDLMRQLYKNIIEINYYLPRSKPFNSLEAIKNFIGNKYFIEETESAKKANRLIKFLELESAFQTNNYQTVVDYYQKLDKRFFPETVLLIRALEKINDFPSALKVWRQLAKEPFIDHASVNFHLSKSTIKHSGIKGLMLDKENTDYNLKRVHLAALCDDSLQLSILNEALDIENQHALLVDLSTRYIFKQQFSKLNSLFKNHSDEQLKEFSAIRTAVHQIANNQSLGKAYMNIAYFLKTQVVDPLYAIPNSLNTGIKPELGKQCSSNVVSNNARGPYFYFDLSLSHFDHKKSSAEEKALYYVSQCRRGGIRSRSCMWGEVNGNMISAKQAFRRLHTKYKNGKWAKKAKFYYER